MTALNIFFDHIVYNKNKAKISLTTTKATNYNNTLHNFQQDENTEKSFSDDGGTDGEEGAGTETE